MAVKSDAEKLALAQELQGKSPEEALKLINKFTGVEELTPEQVEIKQIWADMKEHPELKKTGIDLISQIKLHARNLAHEDEVVKRRKIFKAAKEAVE